MRRLSVVLLAAIGIGVAVAVLAAGAGGHKAAHVPAAGAGGHRVAHAPSLQLATVGGTCFTATPGSACGGPPCTIPVDAMPASATPAPPATAQLYRGTVVVRGRACISERRQILPRTVPVAATQSLTRTAAVPAR